MSKKNLPCNRESWEEEMPKELFIGVNHKLAPGEVVNGAAFRFQSSAKLFARYIYKIEGFDPADVNPPAGYSFTRHEGNLFAYSMLTFKKKLVAEDLIPVDMSSDDRKLVTLDWNEAVVTRENGNSTGISCIEVPVRYEDGRICTYVYVTIWGGSTISLKVGIDMNDQRRPSYLIGGLEEEGFRMEVTEQELSKRFVNWHTIEEINRILEEKFDLSLEASKGEYMTLKIKDEVLLDDVIAILRQFAVYRQTSPALC
jgi:hypothetical protein